MARIDEYVLIESEGLEDNEPDGEEDEEEAQEDEDAVADE